MTGATRPHIVQVRISLTRPDLSTSVGLDGAPHGVRFVPNYMAEQLDEPFDLAINTLSMSEMSEYQIKRYLDLMKRNWLKEGGLFFEQNNDNRPMGLQCAAEVIREEFPEHRALRTHASFLLAGSPNVWSLTPIQLESRKIDFATPTPTLRWMAAGGWKGVAQTLRSAVPGRFQRPKRTAA